MAEVCCALRRLDVSSGTRIASGTLAAPAADKQGRDVRGAAMKIKDIMTGEPRTCSPGTNVAAAAELMLDGDCGILPVVEDGKLVGVVTDRDMYIALATRNARASDLTVREVVRTPVYTCGPDDDVRAALETMRQHCVRRLPVEGFGGTIMGIVAMNDIVLASGPRKPVRDVDVVSALQAICAHHHHSSNIVAA